jgi:hypothetical protein
MNSSFNSAEFGITGKEICKEIHRVFLVGFQCVCSAVLYREDNSYQVGVIKCHEVTAADA